MFSSLYRVKPLTPLASIGIKLSIISFFVAAHTYTNDRSAMAMEMRNRLDVLTFPAVKSTTSMVVLPITHTVNRMG